MKPAPLHLLLALLGFLLCGTAAADVSYPWELDPDFALDGLDVQYTPDRLIVDTRIAIDRRASPEDSVVIVAVWTTNTSGNAGRVELLRYDVWGQPLQWAHNAVPGTNKKRLEVPHLDFTSYWMSADRLVDLKVASSGQIVLLLDGRWWNITGQKRSTAMFVLNPDGSWVGDGDQNDGWALVSDEQNELDSFGAGMALTGAGNMMILTAHDLIDSGPGFKTIDLHRFSMHVNGKPTRKTSWANIGKMSYQRSGCDSGTGPTAWCSLLPTAVAVDPGNTHIYIGGSIPWEEGMADAPNRDMFLLKVVGSDGTTETSFGTDAWYIPEINGFGTWSQTVRAIRFIDKDEEWMPLVLSTMPRACGHGYTVMRISETGSLSARVNVRGGANSGTDCDSIDARDLVLMGDADGTNTRLGVIGHHVSSPGAGGTRGDSGFLRVLNPRSLSSAEEEQLVLYGRRILDPHWGFHSAAFLPDLGQRIFASGIRFKVNEDDASLIAGLRPNDVIFADGFDEE